MVCEYPEKSMTVYLSGGMTNYPAWNHPHFKRVAEWLRRVKGVCVLDPSENGHEKPYEELMEIDFHWVMRADAIVLMPGWWASTGACHELAIARILKKPILNPDLTPCTDKELEIAGRVTVLKMSKREEDGSYSPVLPFKPEDLDKYLVEESVCEPYS
jgi:hypothetical protein